MKKIVAIDTSSRYGSVALCEGSTVVAEYSALGYASRSEKLLGIVDELLRAVDWNIRDVDGFAVVSGPGSFTGIRVGLATVEGLAVATGRPAIAVSSLEALARGLPFCGIPVCPVLDARKGEIYTALYRYAGGKMGCELAEQVIAPGRFSELLPKEVVVTGDGAEVLLTLLRERADMTC